jgi:hypothetical protein
LAVLTPKIVYGTTTLTFTYPPIKKPGANDLEATRNDSFSISGLKQSVYWTTSQFIDLQMDWVPQGADASAWLAFIKYALTGATFSYYPDATSGTSVTCTLDDTKWIPTRNFFGIDKFAIRLRLS